MGCGKDMLRHVERFIHLALGIVLLIIMYWHDSQSGLFEQKLTFQQAVIIGIRYAFAGILVKPDLLPQAEGVIKAWRKK